jgi:hypothetical protein
VRRGAVSRVWVPPKGARNAGPESIVQVSCALLVNANSASKNRAQERDQRIITSCSWHDVSADGPTTITSTG